MTSQLEDELSRTLTGAAAGAPPPGEEFLAGVRGRQRRRRNRRITAGVACAVALTMAGTVTAVGLNTPTRTPLPYQVAAAWNGEIPDFAAARPAQEVWPEAVHRLPKTLPDGRQYQVVDVLGQDRYLITTDKFRMIEPGIVASERDETVAGPAVFDAKAKTVRPLYDQGGEIGQEVVFYGFGAAARVGDWAVWTVIVNRKGSGGFEVWSSRLDGVGGPRRIATLTDHDRAVPHLGVAGDHVYWQQSGTDGTGSAGVYRLPVFGGTPQLIPGTEGYFWFGVSPWVTSTDLENVPIDDSSPPRQGELLNLVTGERRAWVANPEAPRLKCDPVLCGGQMDSDARTMQRLDGTGYRVLSQFEPPVAGGGVAREGRFAMSNGMRSDGRAQYVWDRFTGEAAVTSTGMSERGPQDIADMSFTGFENMTIQWPDGEDGYYVLDLDAIR